MPRYAAADAMRRALEDRLKARARSGVVPLDRLRKEAAFQRLLARIAAAAPEGSWALKGGMAMIARAASRARATVDVDATWRTDASGLGSMLEAAATLDLDDYFQFLIGKPTPIQGEGPEGGLRFPVEARLAGRLFESLRLDINVLPDDPRPLENVALRNLFDFAELPAVVVPAIPPAQQLAEKLHAYTRDYGRQDNTRAKDLYDMLLIAAELPMPSLGDLTEACIATFELRTTAWPPTLNPPPVGWEQPWSSFVRDYGAPFATLEEAFSALAAFWGPVLGGEVPPGSIWNGATWRWESAHA